VSLNVVFHMIDYCQNHSTNFW